MIFPPVPKKILRKMGYLKDQEGIMNRYLRESANWEGHLQKTNNFIVEALQKHRAEKVVVLGSGWLLDFPVKEALALCSKVVLVDICHPKQILNKYKGYENISFVEADITGGLVEAVYNAVKDNKRVIAVFSDETSNPGSPNPGSPNPGSPNPGSPNPGSRIPGSPIPGSPNPGSRIHGSRIPGLSFPASCLIISLNILNQLDILIMDYIKRHIKIPGEDIFRIRQYIQSEHINFLKNYNYCLITDYSEKIINSRDGSVTVINNVYAPLPEGNINSQWEWEFDTQHFYHKNARTVFQVKAVYQSCV